MGGTRDLIQAMEAAVEKVRGWPRKEVRIFHHNDSDGLSSGAILERAFQRAGFGIRRFALEKPYPEVLQRIFREEGNLIVFADFAGRIAPLLSDLNQGRNLTLILDHHAAEPATDPLVLNLDPDLFGLKGDRDISASTTCYLFARAMDPVNEDLAGVAAIGAVGDKFFVEGRLVNQNREVTREAVRQGRMEIRDAGSREDYFLSFRGRDLDCRELGDYLDILGAVGFYQEGPDWGVRVCLEGPSPESDRRVEEYKVLRDRVFQQEIERLKQNGAVRSPHLQWFHVQERFAPMGVKMIGLFCEAVKDTALLDPRRYVAGFQRIPDRIPGFGPIEFNQVKISMRASVFLEGEIRAGRVMGLNVLLPEATRRVGGFSDACHSLTAATTVGVGREEQLVEEMERILASAS